MRSTPPSLFYAVSFCALVSFTRLNDFYLLFQVMLTAYFARKASRAQRQLDQRRQFLVDDDGNPGTFSLNHNIK